jgi:TorA maturation chaperone TorD
VIADTVVAELQAFYSSAGLIIDEEANLAPDHISTELSFMSYLIENGFAEYEQLFLKNHLTLWVPLFCDDMHEHAQTSFYKDAANLLKEFISSEV